MNFVGVDLHKHSISVYVVVQDSAGRRVASRQRFACEDEERIAQWFATQGPFRVVVEATAAYEWFAQLIEPLAERFVLAHPKKLRVIAESAKKTDKLDAQTLAEFLALDMIGRILAADPQGPRTSGAGAGPPSHPAAIDLGEERPAARPGRLQRRRSPPVHSSGTGVSRAA